MGVHENELPRLLTDRRGNHHHVSLPIGSTPESTVSALRDLAIREIHPVLAELVAATPDPFLQTIADVIVPRMVFGRVCLLGDAAFVVRPHTAGAAAKAARDATVLADALRRADDPDLALQTYEKAQLEFGLAMTRYGIDVRYESSVTALEGDNALDRIEITSKAMGKPEWVRTKRLFVAIGGVPNTEWAAETAIVRDPGGYLVTGPDLLSESKSPTCWPLERLPYYLETSVPGSFAAGDVRHRSIKRVATAVGEGAMAVAFVHRYLQETD
jgi:thioredoxin reductase (NADPH)